MGQKNWLDNFELNPDCVIKALLYPHLFTRSIDSESYDHMDMQNTSLFLKLVLTASYFYKFHCFLAQIGFS